MTTKIYCDGCDKEITLKELRTVKLTYSDEFYPPREFDFCEECIVIARENWSPLKWPRKVRVRVDSKQS